MKKRSQTQKYLSVTEVAYYASDPEKYIRNNGAAWNKQAARHGSLIHSNINTSRLGRLVPTIILYIGIIIAGGLLWINLSQ